MRDLTKSMAKERQSLVPGVRAGFGPVTLIAQEILKGVSGIVIAMKFMSDIATGHFVRNAVDVVG